MATNYDHHRGVIETRTVHDVHRLATTLLAEASTGPAPLDVLTELGRFVVEMLRHHHHLEDTDLWPMLTTADPGLSGALDSLSQEHQVLDDALDEVEVVVAGDGDRRRLLRGAVALRDLVHEHLSHEEPILFPALAAHLSDRTWDAFSQRAVATAPTEGNHLMLALLDEVGTPEAVEVVLRNVPEAAREQFPAMRARAAATLASVRRGAA